MERVKLANDLANECLKDFKIVENKNSVIIQSKDRFTIELVETNIKKIKDNIYNARDNFITLGGLLITLSKQVEYVIDLKTDKPYKNIYDLCKNEFDMARGTVQNYISVCNRFGSNMRTVRADFKEYNFTQLILMLKLTDREIKEYVSSNMSCSEIKDLVKGLRAKKPVQSIELETEENVKSVKNSVIKLKNDNDRREFLENFLVWSDNFCVDVFGTNVTYYRCKLENGDFIVVTATEKDKHYCLVSDDTSIYINYHYTNCYYLDDAGINQIIDYLRSNKVNPILGV